MRAVKPLGSAIRGWRRLNVARAMSLGRGFAAEHGGQGQGAGAEGPQERRENHGEGREAPVEDRRAPVGGTSGGEKNKKRQLPREMGNKPKGPEPTRYGDWERAGRCSDF